MEAVEALAIIRQILEDTDGLPGRFPCKRPCLRDDLADVHPRVWEALELAASALDDLRRGN